VDRLDEEKVSGTVSAKLAFRFLTPFPLSTWDDSANSDMASGPSLLRQDGGGGGNNGFDDSERGEVPSDQLGALLVELLRMKYGDSDKYVHGALMAGIRVEVMDFWNFYPGSTSFYEDTKNSFAPVFQIDDDLAKNPLNAVDVLYQLLIDHEDANYGQYVYEPDQVEQLVRRTGLARQHAAERSELVFRTAMSLCDAGDFVLALNDLADKNISTREKVIIACLVALPFFTARCTRVADFFDGRGNLLKGKLDNAVADAAKHLDNAPVRTAGQLDEAFHYTARQWGDVIKREGLRPGSYGTPNGNLSGLGAKLELALPPTRCAPDIRIRIDLEGLRKAGYEIPTPSRVSNVVRGPDGRVYTMPGGGYEMQFPYEIPGKFLEVLPLR